MYHTWFFLRRLANALKPQLENLQLLECFSQQKDELILGFASELSQCYLVADVSSDAGHLGIKNEYSRARKNTVDLFKEAIGLRVIGVEIIPYDRVLILKLEQEKTILLKMYGRRSNVLLMDGDRVSIMFRNNLPSDAEIRLSGFKNDFIPNKQNILRLLGKKNHNLIDNQIDDWINFIDKINLNPIYLGIENEKPIMRLWSITNPLLVTTNAIEASNKWIELHHRHEVFGKRRNALLSHLDKKRSQAIAYIKQSQQKLSEVKTKLDQKELADILMANLHQIPDGKSEVSLFDFYRDQIIEIKLNPKLSPQANAEVYYKKSKNRFIEEQKTEENIKAKQHTLEQLENWIDHVTIVESPKELKKLEDIILPQFQKEESALPYWAHDYSGYQILVGKNARSNDQLTMKVAGKNDLWLHARDTPGSHVVIRNHTGKTIPNPVIEKAAQLAAWFSKRRTETLCPVIYTPRKFVRKIKGAAPGQVVVEKESVVMVEPKNFS